MLKFREAQINDRAFILKANEEINILSGLNDSTFEKRIDQDLFENKTCKSLIAEMDGKAVGMILYSYIYWVNCGKGIYLSQAYVQNEYRQKEIYKQLLQELEKKETECHFITYLVGGENEKMQKVSRNLNFASSSLITYYKKTSSQTK